VRAAHPDYLVLAGGTDVMIGAGARPAPVGVIDLFGLTPLSGIDQEPDGTIRIGAATTYAQILADPIVAAHAPLVAAAAREIGALQIQERGTLGGNVGTSSPVGDTLPVLLALDAVVEVASTRGTRRLAYQDFCTGYRTTALAADELICAVRLPPAPATLHGFWRKVGTRRAQSISKVMLAATARLGADGRVEEARIALGAVRDRPVRARAAEAALCGRMPGAEVAAQVRAALAGDIAPIDDVRSTAYYRRTVAGNLVARFVTWLAEASGKAAA
jgi:CO/xanthine dehydrogenase FAD-binding subunit